MRNKIIQAGPDSKFNYLSWAAILFVAAVIVPLVLGQYPPYYIRLASSILIFLLYGISFNLLYGFTGFLSFGQAAYFGTGAYVSALIIIATDSLFLALLGGAVFPALLSVVLGYFCVKRSKLYFAMLTLAFAQLIYTIAFRWRDVTRGDDGLIVPRIQYLSDPYHFYYFILAIVAVCVLIHWVIVHSSFGHTLKAICQSQDRVSFIGVPVEKQVHVAFIISAFFGGLAGAIYAPYIGIVSPALTHWEYSLIPVIMVVFGGPKYFWGPAIGAIVYMVLKDVVTLYTSYWMIVFGLLLMVIILVTPNGVMGLLEQGVKKFKARFANK